MYRTPIIPGGLLTLLGVIVLSFLMPALLAGLLGMSGPHARLLGWILNHQGLGWLILVLLYEAVGFAILVGVLMAVYTAGLALLRGLAEVKDSASQASASLATLLGELIAWPPQIIADYLNEVFDYASQYVSERRELRRLYREEYIQDFRTYRDFARFWRELPYHGPKGDSGQQQADPLDQAFRLMGLASDCTREAEKRRFRELIAPVHPDKVGPNGLATQLIDAHKLICSRKGW